MTARLTAAALAGLLVLTACGEKGEAQAACQPPPPPEAAAAEAMERITLDAMQAALEGRDPPTTAERSAARRAVVGACLHRAAYVRAEDRSADEAVDATVSECAKVIDGYIKAEAAEAALAGDIPPDRAAMAEMRVQLRAEATARVREAQAGQCWRRPR